MKEYFYAHIAKIDDALKEKPPLSAMRKVLCLINKEEALSNYFFKRVSDIAWFAQLKKEGYLSPNTMPTNKQGEILFWNVLDYLEKVAIQAEQNLNLGKELLCILEGIVQRSRGTKPINNYYIW